MRGEPAKPTITPAAPPGIRAPTESSSFIVEWYRPERKRQIIQVFVLASVLLVAGGTFVGLVHSDRLDSQGAAHWVLSLLGAVCVVAGPLIAVLGFPIAAGSDSYLALRGDGVLLKRKEQLELAAWAEITDVDLNEHGAVVVARGEQDPLVLVDRFMDVTNAELVARIKRAQQRALLGLLRPPPQRRA